MITFAYYAVRFQILIDVFVGRFSAPPVYPVLGAGTSVRKSEFGPAFPVQE